MAGGGASPGRQRRSIGIDLSSFFMFSIFPPRVLLLSLASFLLSTGSTCKNSRGSDPGSSVTFADFENRLENLRSKLKIPGMVAGIVRDGQVLWTKGFGYSNIETKTPVTNSTIFHLASLTKTFASAVIIQLVHENKIDLFAPVSRYNITEVADDTIRIIHLLTHTSEGVPGTNYKYNGSRFGLTSGIIQASTGKSFYELASERIIKPLQLTSTAPGNMNLAASHGLDTFYLQKNLAQGYKSKGDEEVAYPRHFSTAAGMISNIDDMLKYAAAYDGNAILTDDQKAKVFKPMTSRNGVVLPYGLGWFIQEIDGVKLHWHYGYWVGNSSLIVRVPEKKLSFVLMANSDRLSSPYNGLGQGNLLSSNFAKEFLNSFAPPGDKK